MSFFSKGKGGLSVIFDIGPQNVGAAVLLENSGECHIIWTHRESFVGENEKDARKLLEAMISSLKKTNEALQKEALSDLHSQGFTLPSSIYAVLSSPWMELEHKTISYAFKSPTTITKKTISSALGKESAPSGLSDLAIIERTVTGLKLNGYKVKNPYNKKASSLEISFTTTVMPKEILNLIEESVPAGRIEMKAFSSAAYHAIKEISQTDDFIFMAIENNSTELTIVKDAALILHKSIFSGSDELVDAVAGACNVSFAEARSLTGLSFRKDIDKATAEKVALAIRQEREVWNKKIEDSIESDGRLIILPRTTFFIGSDIGFVADIVSNQSIPEFGIGQTPLEIVIVDSTALKDKVLFSDSAHPDARLGLIALGLCSARAKQ